MAQADIGELIAAHYERLSRSARWLVRNIDRAEDLVQTAIERALRHQRSYDPGRPFYPWLSQILRNCAAAEAQRTRETDQVPEAFADTAQGPASTALREAERERIRAAVSALPEAHRQIVELFHFHEMRYAEIADALGIPKGTVMSRLYHARRRLRGLLEEGEDE